MFKANVGGVQCAPFEFSWTESSKVNNTGSSQEISCQVGDLSFIENGALVPGFRGIKVTKYTSANTSKNNLLIFYRCFIGTSSFVSAFSDFEAEGNYWEKGVDTGIKF